MANKLKTIIVYLNNRQLSIRVPFTMWQTLMRHKLDTGGSMSNLVIDLLATHFGTDNQIGIASGLQDHKINTGQSANALINELLIKHFR